MQPYKQDINEGEMTFLKISMDTIIHILCWDNHTNTLASYIKNV